MKQETRSLQKLADRVLFIKHELTKRLESIEDKDSSLSTYYENAIDISESLNSYIEDIITLIKKDNN